MRSPIDLAGHRFGRLVVVEQTTLRRHNNVVWRCVCDCGAEKNVASPDLRLGKASSCGCLRREGLIRRNKERKAAEKGTCSGPDCAQMAWSAGLCRPHYTKAWRAKNPAKPQRWNLLLFKYGLTPDAYQALLDRQHGKCAICKQEPTGYLYVDHDHSCCPEQKTCGACVRGLLCRKCNFLIGLANEDHRVLQDAVDYLEIHTTA